jgi:hypothetical protein
MCKQLFTTFQALPDPPLELIERWQGYLTKSQDGWLLTEEYEETGRQRPKVKTNFIFHFLESD